MNNLLDDVLAFEDEIIANRRHLHQCPEIGFDLEQTTKFVFDKLQEYGLQPTKVGKAGISCLIGQGDKTILLRADMDALPMAEDNDLEFNPKLETAHMCGHDAHTSMLLGAAKLLKQHEDKLNGCVKLMFQPAEEILAGSKDMVENGILENPKVDAAVAIHIATGIEHAKTGNLYIHGGPLTYSADAINIKITGQDAHGSTPYLGVDAIAVAAHTIVALQNVVDKEVSPYASSLILVGKMSGGTACNTVAGEALLNATVRSTTNEGRSFLLQRVKEVSEGIASTFRAKVEVEHEYGMPPLVNDENLANDLISMSSELLGDDKVHALNNFTGSEDFCMIAEKVPAVLMTLGVGSVDEGYEYSLHHPKLTINEAALATGSAVLAYNAMQWLENTK